MNVSDRDLDRPVLRWTTADGSLAARWAPSSGERLPEVRHHAA